MKPSDLLGLMLIVFVAAVLAAVSVVRVAKTDSDARLLASGFLAFARRLFFRSLYYSSAIVSGLVVGLFLLPQVGVPDVLIGTFYTTETQPIGGTITALLQIYWWTLILALIVYLPMALVRFSVLVWAEIITDAWNYYRSRQSEVERHDPV